MAPVGILTEAALSDTWVVRGRARAAKWVPEGQNVRFFGRWVVFLVHLRHYNATATPRGAIARGFELPQRFRVSPSIPRAG